MVVHNSGKEAAVSTVIMLVRFDCMVKLPIETQAILYSRLLYAITEFAADEKPAFLILEIIS